MPEITDHKKEDAKIRGIYSPDDVILDIIEQVYTRKRQMEDSEDRQQALAQWDKNEEQYEAWRKLRGADDWQSNHVVPMTISVVETALSEIIKQNLRPFVLPRGSEDVMKVKLMQFIWDYAWEVSDGDSVTYDVVKDVLMHGTAITQELYRVDKRKIGKVTQVDGKENVEYHEVVDYEDVCTEIVKLSEFFVDEFARGFTGPYAARDCIRRYIMDVHEFHRKYDGSVWDQYGDAKLVKAGGDTGYYEFYEPPSGIDTSNQVEVLHYWNKPEDKFIIVANDILIRNGPNPYKHKQLPFARAVDLKRVHRFYGKGEPELLESTQDETNVLRRMIIDRNHLDIDKMFLVSNRLGLNDEDLIARPHGLIPTDDVAGAKAIEYGDIPRSVELSLKHLEDDSTISTGINPRAQALPTAGTATEAAILKESTLRRIETKIWLLKKEYFMRMARLRLANILQFYPQPKLEKIVGDVKSEEYKQKMLQMKDKGSVESIDGVDYEKSFRTIRTENAQLSFDKQGGLKQEPKKGYGFFEIRPEYYMPSESGGYDVKFNVGSNVEISKPLMQTKNLELFDRLMPIATTIPNTYDPVKLGDMILEDHDKNPEDYKVEQPMPDEGEQRIQMQIQLASLENQQLMKEIAVPATPFAAPFHTQVHIEFMNSSTFQQLPNESSIIKNFTDHVMGEIIAQETRGQSGVGAAVPPKSDMGLQEEPQKNGKKIATRMGQGMENRPGGMAKPANKMGDVLPSFNNGGNRNLP